MKKLSILTKLHDFFLVQEAAETDGEEWQDEYKKFPDLFVRILRLEAEIERKVGKVFKKYAEKIDELVDWGEVSERQKDKDKTKKAAGRPDVVKPLYSPPWRDFNEDLREVIEAGMWEAMVLSEEYTNRDVPLQRKFKLSETTAESWLNDYALDLVSGLNKTTKDRLRSTLVRSIRDGLSQDEMKERVQQVVNNPVRAQTISRTETVRAFNQARYSIKDQHPNSRKILKTMQDGRVRPAHAAMQDQVRHIGSEFVSPLDAKVRGQTPPFEPNCRCFMKVEILEDTLPVVNPSRIGDLQRLFDWEAGGVNMRSKNKSVQQTAVRKYIESQPEMTTYLADDFDWEYAELRVGDEIKSFVEVGGGDLVNEYANNMLAGSKFPPIVGVQLGGENMIWDGNHRSAALAQIGAEVIPLILGKPKV